MHDEKRYYLELFVAFFFVNCIFLLNCSVGQVHTVVFERSRGGDGVRLQSQSAVARMIEGQRGGIVACDEQVAAHIELVALGGDQERVADVLLDDALEGNSGLGVASHGLSVTQFLQRRHARDDSDATATVRAGWLVDPDPPRDVAAHLSGQLIFIIVSLCLVRDIGHLLSGGIGVFLSRFCFQCCRAARWCDCGGSCGRSGFPADGSSTR